ncbi:hypothetical protein Hanom_Chr12g01158391 [Helianthus anomalus]
MQGVWCFQSSETSSFLLLSDEQTKNYNQNVRKKPSLDIVDTQIADPRG